jgi:hypothetical protein
MYIESPDFGQHYILRRLSWQVGDGISYSVHTHRSISGIPCHHLAGPSQTRASKRDETIRGMDPVCKCVQYGCTYVWCMGVHHSGWMDDVYGCTYSVWMDDVYGWMYIWMDGRYVWMDICMSVGRSVGLYGGTDIQLGSLTATHNLSPNTFPIRRLLSLQIPNTSLSPLLSPLLSLPMCQARSHIVAARIWACESRIQVICNFDSGQMH